MPNTRAFWIALLVTSAAITAQRPLPSGGALRPDQACFDVGHYRLELRVDPDTESIAGRLTMRARVTEPTSEIALDLDGRLTVHDVHVGEDLVEASVGDGRISIPLAAEAKPDTELVVSVRYSGEPRVAPNPPWQGGFTWSKTRDGSPWIATSCQGEGADLWWPCKDHPSDEAATMDLLIEVPKELVVASNGTLESDRLLDDGWRRFHWHVANPINNYGVALAIAPYVSIDDKFTSVSGDEVDVVFWALPEHEAKARAVLPEFIDHVKHMEELCGPYPFRNEKYGVVQTPHLGMEHQTIIAYGYGFQRHPPGYDWLHHHEMAHEWWANLVTCRDWKDMWIHEGIGTYMQALYVESRFGKDAMRQTMRQQRVGMMNRKAVAPRKTQTTHEIYFSSSGNDIYNKGSWITHTLRYVLGDETFFKTLRRWAYPDPAMEKVTDGSQTRLTDTDEIREIAERVSGVELGWFFDVYLHQPRLPRLKHEVKDGTLHLTWTVPGELPFPMPVPVEVDGSIRRVAMDGNAGTLKIGDADYRIDPEGWLLKRGGGRRRR